MTAPDAPVAVIVGTGLIGASIGRSLVSAGYAVHLEDETASHATVAAGLGAGTVDAPLPEAVGLVVVAVPPSAIPDVVSRSLERYAGATVTDVGSVKAGVLATLWERSHDLDRYVGSHPMAGSQHSGPLTAHPHLFVDRTWVITPHRRSRREAVDDVAALVAACGARAVIMDVDDHDAAVARVSHLPHLLSVLMAGHLTTVPSRDLALAGQGLRDVTRVAGSDPGLWEQILGANEVAVLAELRSVADELGLMIKAVESGVANGELRGRLERGVDGTRRIGGKHGGSAVAYSQVVVAIPDAPGALARLFSDVGAAGANVEDIAIEHDQAREVGYLAISVAPDEAESVMGALLERGWEVS